MRTAVSPVPPEWRELTIPDEQRWTWREGKLVARHRLPDAIDTHARSGLRNVFLKFLYADQNRSGAVRRALASLLARLDAAPSGWGVCIGAGGTNLHPRVLNLDLFDGNSIQIVHDGGNLPFKDNSISLAICQEVLEHVADDRGLVAEIRRVLGPGGRIYVQVPFQIGYHSGPKDYRRYSEDALRDMFDNEEWRLEEIGISVGHGSGFYRIAVEFFAVTAAALSRHLYMVTKVLFALVLYPVKLADVVTKFSPQAHRIPGGYYVIAEKRVP